MLNLEALGEFGKAKDAIALITIIAEMEADKRDICSCYLKGIRDRAEASFQRIVQKEEL